jgi:Fuc2NAc and GlcNAc transferase
VTTLELWLTPLVFIVATAGTVVLRRYGEQRLLDVPNDRSSHARPVPRGGGVAIVLAFLAGVVTLRAAGGLPTALLVALLVGGGLIAAVGFWDDHVSLSARLRFSLHVAAAVLATWLIGPIEQLPLLDSTWHLPEWLAWPVSVLAIVWLLNLYNFMDGIDGIAAGEAVTVALGAALIAFSIGAHVPGLYLLAAAAAGFLVFNWPPARIFMGDAGSGFLGYVFGVFLLYSTREDPQFLWVWLILLAVFWIDATLTLSRRFLAGERWHAPHRSHAYQHAAVLLRSHLPVTLSVIGINVLVLVPLATLAALLPRHAYAIALGSLALMAAIALSLGSGRRPVRGVAE